jgi:nicotinate-nucleotide pyrophosphorylase
MQEKVAASAKPAIAAIAAHGTSLKFSRRLSAGTFLGIGFVSLKLELSYCQFTVCVSKPEVLKAGAAVARVQGNERGQLSSNLTSLSIFADLCVFADRGDALGL